MILFLRCSRKMSFITFIVLLVLSTTCQTVLSQNANFTNAVNCFSLRLMEKLPPPNGNGIMSPFSVDIVLSMLMLGARGNTLEELNFVLQNKANGLTLDDVKNGFRSAIQKVTSNGNVTVDIANAMWTDQGYTVNNEYKQSIQDTFMADQRSGDFKNNPSKATDDINAWVKNKTKSMIDKLFDKPLDTSTIMVLLNAIYFKGDWMYKFDKANTKPQPFYNGGDNSKPTTIDFMNQQRKFAFKHDSQMKAKILRMDYKGGSMSFVAFLPDEGVTMTDVEKKVNCLTINDVLKFPSSSEVNVVFPKFEQMSDLQDLKDALQALGLNAVFGGGDLSGIGQGSLSLTKIVQKAKIKVNEEGSEAAAVTGGVVSLTSVMEPPPEVEQFVANRPFCYFIVDKKSGLILFGGKQSQF